MVSQFPSDIASTLKVSSIYYAAMIDSQQSLGFVALALAFVATVLLLFRRRRSPFPLPPGPRGYPIIGNIFDMPSLLDQTWLTFAKWGEQYGEIYSLRVLGQTIVVLNSVKNANDMLAVKSSIYSDRPPLVMAGELGGWNQTTPICPYDDRWRHMRRLIRDAIGTPAANKRFDSGKELEARRLLRNILANPDKLVDHLRLTAGATMLRDAYGYEVADEVPDPFIAIATEALDQFSRTAWPPYYLVEFFPWLKHIPAWFPGAYFKRYAKNMSDTLQNMAQLPYDFAKKEIANGTAPVSFVSSLLDTNSDEELIKWTATSLYSGASDTSVSAIYAGFLAMILYPEVAAKAQAEIDKVVGSERLPTFEDRPNLPYVNAFIKEVHRWNSVAPLGGPHCSVKDDIHSGYFIPKGTIILTNLWKMSHDENTYLDPMTFNPDRFLGSHPEPDPMDFVFGFGRRSCPGKYFGDASVYIACAMSLAVFNVSKAIDSITGEVITPVYRPLSGTISHPTPYECTIKSRNEKAAALILQTE